MKNNCLQKQTCKKKTTTQKTNLQNTNNFLEQICSFTKKYSNAITAQEWLSISVLYPIDSEDFAQNKGL